MKLAYSKKTNELEINQRHEMTKIYNSWKERAISKNLLKQKEFLLELEQLEKKWASQLNTKIESKQKDNVDSSESSSENNDWPGVEDSDSDENVNTKTEIKSETPLESSILEVKVESKTISNVIDFDGNSQMKEIKEHANLIDFDSK
jgi:hypothetical protein